MFTCHFPVLVEPIVEALIEPFLQLPLSAESHWLVDCTLGGGGHCSSFLKEFLTKEALQKHRVLAVDQDYDAVQRAKARFHLEITQGRLEVVHGRFGELREVVSRRPVLGLMADLGFSSDQLQNSERGLSFRIDGPLDMRLDPSQGQSCFELLQQISESELEMILREWGEERFSRRISSAIIERRCQGVLPATTQELVDVVVKATPPQARHGRIHVATRTFQALRMAVNDELGQLDALLNQVIPSVKEGGRVAILSFHSLEDRKVKRFFQSKKWFYSLTKKPLQASEEETRSNPRARSAKLRLGERFRLDKQQEKFLKC